MRIPRAGCGDRPRLSSMTGAMLQQQSVVGFIGLGAIGSPMAERLVAGGEEVIVYNRTISKAARFRGRSRIAASPAEVAEHADIVFVCLTDGDSYRDVVLGPRGIARGSRIKTYVHVGTNEVPVVEELAAALETQGVATLVAPVTGGVDKAVAGTLTVMASGAREAFSRAEPFLKHYADKIVFLGESVGAAQVMKLVNHVLMVGNLALACEAMVLGRKCGLDPVAMLEIINNSNGRSDSSLTKIPTYILPRTFNHGGALALSIMNMEAFGLQAKLHDMPIPLAEAVTASMRAALAQEGDAADVTQIIRPMERSAGVTIATAGAAER
jgi:3-hydroxyisobutyrate dehydrogenase-like beta-hydroxyacid dehydrogenase